MTILLVVLIVLLLVAFPRWPHSRAWGYTPVGVIGIVLLVLLLLMLFEMVPY